MTYEVRFKNADDARSTYRALVNHYRHFGGNCVDLSGIRLNHTVVTVRDTFKKGLDIMLGKQTENMKRGRFKVVRVSEKS